LQGSQRRRADLLQEVGVHEVAEAVVRKGPCCTEPLVRGLHGAVREQLGVDDVRDLCRVNAEPRRRGGARRRAFSESSQLRASAMRSLSEGDVAFLRF
jgi:hypothetical protein